MRTVFIGDIFGRPGREVLVDFLPAIRENYKPDLVLANAENAAHGRGITPKIAEELFELGIDCLTLGNHAWDQREIIPYIERTPALIRPLNLPGKVTPGRGFYDMRLQDGRRAIIINIIGRLFMEMSDDPFAVLDQTLQPFVLGSNVDFIFVDCHAETTSEKYALGHYFDGRITGLIGTHTHVPTADAHILPAGTAYQSDAGMTGSFESVIGVEKQAAIGRFIKKVPGKKFIPAAGEGTLCGVYIESRDSTGMATKIEPIRCGGLLSPAGLLTTCVS